MKYFILILLSFNISTAYANECSGLFMQQRVLSESEINTVIQDLHLLATQKYSSDKQVSQISKSLFDEKYNDLAHYIPREEIQKRIRNFYPNKPEVLKNKTGPSAIHKLDAMALENLSLANDFLAEMSKTKKADLNSILYYAAAKKRFELIPSLYLLGADSRLYDIFAQTATVTIKEPFTTALNLVVESGNKDLVEYMLDHKANLDATDAVYNSPLHTAAKRGDKDIALLLVDRGAKLNSKNKRMQTPIELAENYPELHQMLKQIKKEQDKEQRAQKWLKFKNSLNIFKRKGNTP